MIKVGFVMTHTVQNWNGGVNYLRNLVHALRSVPGRKVDPVLVVPPDTPEKLLAGFPQVEVVRSRLVGRAGRGMRSVSEALLGRDLLLERLLRSKGIEVLSHSDPIGVRAGLPTIGWLTDFQHRRMPEFFSSQELATRDAQDRRIIACSTTVVVSSRDAQKDLAAFAPQAAAKSRVLHFTSGSGASPQPVEIAQLQQKYGFSGEYFHLPNQFWAHKNHRLVIDALALLASRGQRALVLVTGHTEDYRHPEFFAELMRYVAERGVVDSFRVLGVVPYQDLVALMKQSVAVINPSKFEGWSTTVEESKSFGIRVLLSDIPVHREQKPDRGSYFPVDGPTELADLMSATLSDFSPDSEREHRQLALERLPERFVRFGQSYAGIVEEVAR